MRIKFIIIFLFIIQSFYSISDEDPCRSYINQFWDHNYNQLDVHQVYDLNIPEEIVFPGFGGTLIRFFMNIPKKYKLTTREDDLLKLFSVYYRLGLVVVPFSSADQWSHGKFLLHMNKTYQDRNSGAFLTPNLDVLFSILKDEEKYHFFRRLFKGFSLEDFEDDLIMTGKSHQLPNWSEFVQKLPEKSYEKIMNLVHDVLTSKHPIWGSILLDSTFDSQFSSGISRPSLVYRYLSKNEADLAEKILSLTDELNILLIDGFDNLSIRLKEESFFLDDESPEEIATTLFSILSKLPPHGIEEETDDFTSYRAVSLSIEDIKNLYPGSIVSTKSLYHDFPGTDSSFPFLFTTPFYHKAVSDSPFHHLFDEDQVIVMMKIKGHSPINLSKYFQNHDHRLVYPPSSKFIIESGHFYRGTYFIEAQEIIDVDEGPYHFDMAIAPLSLVAGHSVGNDLTFKQKIFSGNVYSMNVVEDLFGRLWHETPIPLLNNEKKIKELYSQSLYHFFHIPTPSIRMDIPSENFGNLYEEVIYEIGAPSNLELNRSENFRRALLVAALLGDFKRPLSSSNLDLGNEHFMLTDFSGALQEEFFQSRSFKKSLKKLLSMVEDKKNHPWNHLSQDDYSKFRGYLLALMRDNFFGEEILPFENKIQGKIFRQLKNRIISALSFLDSIFPQT